MDATQAEKDVLGAIIVDNSVLTLASEHLKPSDFSTKAHQDIFATMLNLGNKGEPIDLATLGFALQHNTFVNEIGFIGYFIEITNTLPSACFIVYHAKIVKEASLRRRLKELAIKTAALADDKSKINVPTIELIQTLENELVDITDRITAQDWSSLFESSKDAVQDILDISNGQNKGVFTGFKDLDRLLSGLRPGSVSILAARPGMGKTAFALNIVQNVAIANQTPCAIFSLEMTKKELAMRFISSLSGVDSNAMRNGNLTDAQWEALFNTMDAYQTAPVYIDDTPAINIQTLRDRAKRLVQQKDVRLIVIDYLQLISSESKRVNSREQEVADISRALKRIAKELNLPVICLSQLNRSTENRTDKRPFLSDLRESGSIEQDADNILFIHRDDYYSREKANETEKAKDPQSKTKLAEIIVAKQRAGSTGTIELWWNGSTTTFTDKNDYFAGWNR